METQPLESDSPAAPQESGMSKGEWYVVQVLSGHEQKVQRTLDVRILEEGLEDVIFEVLVPMEKVSEVKLGQKRTTNRKFFPGYIMIRVALYDEDRRLHERAWTFICQTNSIIGFVGGDRPVPLTKSEVQDIMDQLNKGQEAAKPRIEFELGEMVRIREGAFESLEGKIEEIDPNRGRLKLSVTIFGRTAPVEVEYWQVERS